MPEVDAVPTLPRAEVSPYETLRNIAGGYALPRCLHLIADLGVADALDETPRTANELARSVGAHPDALSRMMRLLAAHGVRREIPTRADISILESEAV